jgi:hypothetical protein
MQSTFVSDNQKVGRNEESAEMLVRLKTEPDIFFLLKA